MKDAYEGLQSNDKVVQLYISKYLDVATQSRDISEYAYRRGGLALLDFLDAERSYRATELGLPADAGFLFAGARAASRSGGHENSALVCSGITA